MPDPGSPWEVGDTGGGPPPASENQMETTAPVAALTFLGVLLAAIGLFVAGNILIVVIGLLSIFGAGLLQVVARRT